MLIGQFYHGRISLPEHTCDLAVPALSSAPQSSAPDRVSIDGRYELSEMGVITHVGLMGEESDESDEKFATGIEADWVPRPPLEFFRAVVQSLYELEHGAG